MRTIIEMVAAVSRKVVINPVYERTLYTPFVFTKHWHKSNGEMMHTLEITVLQHRQRRHESWSNDVSLKQFY